MKDRPPRRRSWPLALAIVLGLARPAGAAPAGGPERVPLFRAGERGYATYRIPGIVATPDGVALAYCEAREQAGGDWGTIRIALRRSEDGGRSWGPVAMPFAPPEDAAPNPAAMAQGLSGPGQITMNNPVAIVDREAGAIHFLYCVEYARCFSARSDDGGRTWSDPAEITPAFDAFREEYPCEVLATGPGHGVQLSTGRLVVPVWLSSGEGGHAHRPSAVATIFSDDHGRTWQAGSIVVRHPDPVNPSETVVAELPDGRVMLNIRHESEPHLRGVVVGPDGATGWSPMRFDDELPEPICMGSLARHPGGPRFDGPVLLFANPHNPDGRERKNLTIKLSPDGGASWPASRVLEPGPSGYSDLAVSPDGTVLCFFEDGALGGSAFRPARLSLARFGLDWLTEAPGPSPE